MHTLASTAGRRQGSVVYPCRERFDARGRALAAAGPGRAGDADDPTGRPTPPSSSDSPCSESEPEEEDTEPRRRAATSTLMLSASAASSGWHLASAARNANESFGRSTAILGQTCVKLVREQKFWVTATVRSMLTTTWCQPPGINTVSPGFWMNSIGGA